METQVKEKMNEVDLQKVENYLETVAEHLFLTEKERFFKAFPVKIKDKLYCVSLEFDGVDFCDVRMFDADYYIKNYKSNAKNVISNILFPQHGDNKKVSIPNFKAMKKKTAEIKKLIEEKFNGTNRQVITAQIEKVLVGLTVKK